MLITLFFNALFYALNENSAPWRLLCGARRRRHSAPTSAAGGAETGAAQAAAAPRRRKGPLAVTNRASGVPAGARPATYWCWDLLSPADLYAASWQPQPAAVGAGATDARAPPSQYAAGSSSNGGGGSSLVLAGFRLLQFAVFVFVIGYEQGVYAAGAEAFLKFFTNW